MLFHTAPIFIVEGDVRPRIYQGKSLAAALRALNRDHRECARLGGGAYSDARLSVRMGRHEYSVKTEAGDDGEYELASPSRYCNELKVIEAIGAEIAQGNGIRRPRLRRDDWSGWFVSRDELGRIAVEWPDSADSLQQVRRTIEIICAIQ